MNQVFTSELKKEAEKIVAQYETKRASILEVLRLLMEHYGYISLEIEEAVAVFLEIPPIDVREVVSFYTLFYTKAKAKNRFSVCRTLSCSLLGGRGILEHLENKLGLKAGQTAADGSYSLHAVECLGACEIAPMMQVNDQAYIGSLTKEKIDKIVDEANRDLHGKADI